jgi:hypothetical protein
MTDAEALALIEDLRRNARDRIIAEVCTRILAIAQRDAVAAARRATRNAYMAALLRRRRREKREERAARKAAAAAATMTS